MTKFNPNFYKTHRDYSHPLWKIVLNAYTSLSQTTEPIEPIIPAPKKSKSKPKDKKPIEQPAPPAPLPLNPFTTEKNINFDVPELIMRSIIKGLVDQTS